MSEKTLLCTGCEYRGVMIHQVSPDQVFILGENGNEYEFISVPEAKAFVDAFFAMSGLFVEATG